MAKETPVTPMTPDPTYRHRDRALIWLAGTVAITTKLDS